ncbi:hypothetical protein A6723_024340 [Pseudomonas sp. AU11447]|uniref:DUF2793 domain-containing protein n=1 Tax=unclassified Pseudomonas TaxID=196821 RepID=UPI0006D3B931|nr:MULTISPECIES: DUF2793 domain-containing protein [unclassified Pseudomonas]OBY91189.1 hypothetical protein A6723_024340 [Pseudomonas sp. AU11447]
MTTPHAKLLETANGQDNALNVNEALAWIDVLLKTPVISRTLTAAPGSPLDGAFYIMASAWAGVTGAAANALALYRTSLGWQARTPETGWVVEDATDGNLYRFSGSAWVLQPKGISGVSNSGSGAQVLASIDGSRNVVARRLVAGTNVTITQNTDDITISASGGGGGGSGSVINQTDSASLPAASTAGNVSLLTDKNILVFDSGTSWLPWGPVNKLVAPPTSGWSWVNQGTSAITSSAFDQVLTGGAAGAGANVVARVRTAPGTPYTITTHLKAVMAHKAFQSYGLCFRNSTSGAMHIFDVIASDLGLTTVAIRSTKFNSGTSFNADYTTVKIPQMANWLRISDNGTNRICSISEDGVNWLVIHTIGRTDFITADQVGFVVGVENSATPNFAPILRVMSWEQT